MTLRDGPWASVHHQLPSLFDLFSKRIWNFSTKVQIHWSTKLVLFLFGYFCLVCFCFDTHGSLSRDFRVVVWQEFLQEKPSGPNLRHQKPLPSLPAIGPNLEARSSHLSMLVPISLSCGKSNNRLVMGHNWLEKISKNQKTKHSTASDLVPYFTSWWVLVILDLIPSSLVKLLPFLQQVTGSFLFHTHSPRARGTITLLSS
jgi:hypothetical protein